MTDTVNFKEQLDSLEKQLSDAYEEFKKVYKENYDNVELTNEEVYRHVIDEDIEYNNELDDIKLKTINIMHEIHKQHDQKAYDEILKRLHESV